MKRSLIDGPDPFVLAPALALVPSLGQVSKLASLQQSLHARREKNEALRQEMERQNSSRDRDGLRRIAAEEAMLSVVLGWLSTHAPHEA